MRYAGVGALAGFLAVPLLGLPPGSWIGSVIVGALVCYLISCWVFPFARCPWCRDAKRRGDGHGNWRPRNCRVCADKPYVRVGARMLWWVDR